MGEVPFYIGSGGARSRAGHLAGPVMAPQLGSGKASDPGLGGGGGVPRSLYRKIDRAVFNYRSGLCKRDNPYS